MIKRFKTPLTIVAFAGMALLGSALPAATIINGFSSESTTGLTLTTIDGTWHNASTNVAWDISSGVLTHSPVSPYGAADEALIGQIVDLTSFEGNSLTLSFDYNVATGNTLYAHLRGVDSSTTAWSMNLGAQNGNSWDTNTGGTTYNLFDGLTLPNSGTANSGDADEAVSFAGGTSGSYSVTIDLSGYTVSDISDYGYLMLGFAANASADSASTISNLSLTVVPEPGTYALLGGLLALGHVMLRRRR